MAEQQTTINAATARGILRSRWRTTGVRSIDSRTASASGMTRLRATYSTAIVTAKPIANGHLAGEGCVSSGCTVVIVGPA